MDLVQFFCHVFDDDLTTQWIASVFGKKTTEFLNCESEGLRLKNEGEPFYSRLVVMSISTRSAARMQKPLRLEKPNLGGRYSE
jgi:hypothetical protein